MEVCVCLFTAISIIFFNSVYVGRMFSFVSRVPVYATGQCFRVKPYLPTFQPFPFLFPQFHILSPSLSLFPPRDALFWRTMAMW